MSRHQLDTKQASPHMTTHEYIKLAMRDAELQPNPATKMQNASHLIMSTQSLNAPTLIATPSLLTAGLPPTHHQTSLATTAAQQSCHATPLQINFRRRAPLSSTKPGHAFTIALHAPHRTCALKLVWLMFLPTVTQPCRMLWSSPNSSNRRLQQQQRQRRCQQQQQQQQHQQQR
jgi:hypothetical protein